MRKVFFKSIIYYIKEVLFIIFGSIILMISIKSNIKYWLLLILLIDFSSKLVIFLIKYRKNFIKMTIEEKDEFDNQMNKPIFNENDFYILLKDWIVNIDDFEIINYKEINRIYFAPGRSKRHFFKAKCLIIEKNNNKKSKIIYSEQIWRGKYSYIFNSYSNIIQLIKDRNKKVEFIK